jgi:hypothetical protein
MDADVVGNITERAEDDDAGQKDLYAQSLPIGIPLQDRMKVPITIDENEDENKVCSSLYIRIAEEHQWY